MKFSIYALIVIVHESFHVSVYFRMVNNQSKLVVNFTFCRQQPNTQLSHLWRDMFRKLAKREFWVCLNCLKATLLGLELETKIEELRRSCGRSWDWWTCIIAPLASILYKHHHYLSILLFNEDRVAPFALRPFLVLNFRIWGNNSKQQPTLGSLKLQLKYNCNIKCNIKRSQFAS